MDVLMLSAELAPYLRATETGDAVAALSRALAQTGHRVTLALPYFQGAQEAGLMVARRLSLLEVPEVGPVTVYDGQLPSGVGIVLFESRELPPAEQVYGDDILADAKRFLMTCRAALALFEQRAQQGNPFDVVHAHDWPGAFFGLLPERPPWVFTVHDANEHGLLSLNQLESLGLELDDEQLERLRSGTQASLLQAGVLSANVATTVSPTMALELKDTTRFGDLAVALAEVPIQGVLGGVDYAIYNPAVDTALSSRFDAESPELKGNSKTALCRELELDLDPVEPLLVYAGPLDEAHGAQALLAILPELLKREARVVIVGSGSDEALLAKFSAAKLKRSSRYRFVDSNVRAQWRKALAAADVALCPSVAQYSGHSVRVAQRYGAVPVAANVAGNRDAVVDCDVELETGTGFLFDPTEPVGLLSAVERALAATHSPRWGRLRRRVLPRYCLLRINSAMAPTASAHKPRRAPVGAANVRQSQPPAPAASSTPFKSAPRARSDPASAPRAPSSSASMASLVRSSSDVSDIGSVS